MAGGALCGHRSASLGLQGTTVLGSTRSNAAAIAVTLYKQVVLNGAGESNGSRDEREKLHNEITKHTKGCDPPGLEIPPCRGPLQL